VVIASSASTATTITVSQTTRKRLGSLKEGGQTYDEVIEELLAARPNRLTCGELGRRFSEARTFLSNASSPNPGPSELRGARVAYVLTMRSEARSEFLRCHPPCGGSSRKPSPE
jgi:predicted CopG family antitoxin